MSNSRDKRVLDLILHFTPVLMTSEFVHCIHQYNVLISMKWVLSRLPVLN